MKVIITDVNSRKAFDVVSIMKNAYKYDCLLCAQRDNKFQLPLIYGQQIFLLRQNDYQLFEHDLKNILNKYPNEDLVYLPVSEKPTKLFYKFVRNNKFKNLLYRLPDEHSFDMVSDKLLFQEYCESFKFPVPNAFKFNNIAEIESNNNFPLIFKPRKGEGSVGIIQLSNLEDLNKIRNIELNQYVVQQKLKNSVNVQGVFFFCVAGKIINAYSHQRIRTFPYSGGVTVFSRNNFNEEIYLIGKNLLENLNWNGLAMIEFLYDESTGSWKIIEVNPRIWGSILLSCFSQNHLLQDYVETLYHKKEESFEYKKNRDTFIRWLFPFDLLNFIKGKISFNDLIDFDFKNNCYINFTYSSIYRSISYLVYFTFNLRSIRRFIKKIF